MHISRNEGKNVNCCTEAGLATIAKPPCNLRLASPHVIIREWWGNFEASRDITSQLWQLETQLPDPYTYTKIWLFLTTVRHSRPTLPRQDPVRKENRGKRGRARNLRTEKMKRHAPKSPLGTRLPYRVGRSMRRFFLSRYPRGGLSRSSCK